MIRAAFSVVFILILFLAKVAIFDLANANGLNDVLTEFLHGEPSRFTSLKPVDSLLTLLVHFFQPIITGKDPSLTLFCVFMAGQLLAVHMLILLEGLRAGNRGKLVSLSTFWGQLWQLITFGATLPVYFLLWIWTSPIPEAAEAALADAVSVDPVQGRAVTGAFTVGALLPTIAAALPSPAVVSPRTQELAMAAWQAFPLWTGLAQAFLAALVERLGLVPEATRRKPQTKIDEFRRVYTYTLSCVAVTYVGVLGYVYAKAHTAAGVAPAELLGQMFWPTAPWDTRPVASMEKGVLVLLQWDMYCATLATWTWLAYAAYKRGGVGQVVTDLGKGAAWSAVVGPGGAALVVVWGRDVDAIRAAARKEKWKTGWI